MRTWWQICFVALFLAACSHCGQTETGQNGCLICHEITLDENHQFSCTSCHKGDAKAGSKAKAHKGLERWPASPENAGRFCGSCHRSEILSISHSSHYNLDNEIGMVWQAFFPGASAPRLKEIHAVSRPATEKELVMDLLARRCLRCHPFYEGDDYSGVRRGKGCASCHMKTGRKVSHLFRPPETANCLSCHYGNFTGWDYVGRFEKDYPEDFRAPLERGRHVKRPYGVEWIEMQPDIHFRKGLSCTDCHEKREFHVEASGPQRPSCVKCHISLSERIGHLQSSVCKAECETCHAAWSFWDQGRSLLRKDAPDPEEWLFLAVQGSSEVEKQITEWADMNSGFSFKSFMKDKINGGLFPGLWFSGFEKRRWAPVELGLGVDGHLSVMRPILSLSLSYVDASEETVLDGIRPRAKGRYRLIYPDEAGSGLDMKAMASFCLPYHPHTTAGADFIRSVFVSNFINQCRQAILRQKTRTEERY